MLTDFQIVIPGRRSEAEAEPPPVVMDSGLSILGLSADGLAPE